MALAFGVLSWQCAVPVSIRHKSVGGAPKQRDNLHAQKVFGSGATHGDGSCDDVRPVGVKVVRNLAGCDFACVI